MLRDCSGRSARVYATRRYMRMHMTPAATGDRPILLRTEMGAGHGGPTGRYDAWRDEARTLVFQLLTL